MCFSLYFIGNTFTVVVLKRDHDRFRYIFFSFAKNKVGGDHKRNSTQLPDGWEKHEDEEGNRYYAEEATGMTAWDAPPGSVGGSAGGGELLTGNHGRSCHY